MKLTDMKMTDMKMQDMFQCLNRSDDIEHCRMHGIVSETFDRAYFLIFIYLIFSLILYIVAF